MNKAKTWLILAVLAVGLAAGAALTTVIPSQTAIAQAPGPGDHWRNFDGHWSYWHAGDNRWYYTDGSHWYYHDGLHWVIYGFDRLFGREFHHGSYRAPGPGAEVVLPRHDVFHHR